MEDTILLASICSSVARLHRRLFSASLDRKRVGPLGNQRNEGYQVGEIDPPSAWLSGVREGLSVVYVADSSAAVLEGLLSVLESGRVDRRTVCLLLQRLAVEAPQWTPPVLKLARQWDVELPDDPRVSLINLPPYRPFRRSVEGVMDD